MIQFTKLRLHGFKSFVDKTEMDICPGLTGIVGPNGCGKSNLVEALRWSMGENSSKRMRGGTGSMEDVIFNGTANRPARNMAEVSVLLDNTKRDGPAAYNNTDEIEVIRKIEKDHGSGYRINGKNVRARDVQLLYADILAGANSPFLVSQGKITNIINAKPSERRMILEEAAGISGLYARRHEAELRLRATDTNLGRLEDLLGSMEERLNGLKKQARQANRYRNLSAQIRQLELMIYCMEWRRAFDKLQEVESKFSTEESTVADRLTVVSQLTKTQNVQAQDLPELRQKDAEMGAALQAQKLTLQRLEDEETRLSTQLEEFRAQLEQAKTDKVHEQDTLKENTAILEKLEKEEAALKSNQDNEDQILAEREKTRDAIKERVDEMEATHAKLMEEVASARARKQSLESQIEQDIRREENLTDRLSGLKEQLTQKKADNEGEDKTAEIRQDVEKLEEQSVSLREEIKGYEEKLTKARSNTDSQRETVQQVQNDVSKLEAETGTLESVVNLYADSNFKPVFEDVRTDKGFESALSRALGDTLMASTDSEAPIIWESRNVADLPSLPAGVEQLQPHVKAPRELELALSQIGFVENSEDGKTYAAQLKPGQSLVSREGAYWRWDGLHIKATASDRHAAQLQQKNRLLEIQKQLPALQSKLAEEQERLEQTQKKHVELQEELSGKQAASNETEEKLKEKRRELDRTIEQNAEYHAEVAKLEEAITIVETDLKELKGTFEENKKALEQFDPATLEEQQNNIEETREKLSAVREEYQNAISELEVSKQDHNRRKARLQAIGDERINLQNRCIRATERLKELGERSEQLAEKIEELKKRPSEIKEEREALLEKVSGLEKERSTVSDKLAAVENELAETTKALKQAESELGNAREQRAHSQATREERTQNLENVKAAIRENFDMSPEELMAETALDPENLPDLNELKEQKEKAVRGRDLIGAVNLRAEEEAQELEKELGGILNERNDLAEAINELRQGINKLNREARERLQVAFEHVNGHFREMFTRLFGGGKAHLALIESDDPLEAGLEIFAQPPGKALQSLSLLSGGEQTMTAVAVIFAMFLTNPAPICVLDEVDAPLDDANVDRFCDLLDEFAERGETRFILITHHRLTMARMDRLYGVTMSERGVSQLVSVDMNQQLDFLDAAE